MSQQGDRPAAHENDWWRRLYDETARDTGATNAADSLDDRFDSASDAVGRGGGGRGGIVGEGDGDGGEDVGGAGASVAGPAPVSVPPAVPDPRSLPDLPSVPPVPSVPSVPSVPPVPSVPSVPSVPFVPPLPKRPVADRSVAPQGPTADVTAEAPEPASAPARRPVIGHVGDRPPTYDAEPTALPATVPQELDDLVADTVLDGARYGTYTLRAASVRGDSARFRGEPRRDALLTVRFGTDRNALVLVAVATGARATERGHLAAADACRWIGGAVGRSFARLSEDIGAGRRGDLKSGLHRLTDRTYGKLRARAAELGLEPEQYTAGLRCLLLSADPDCRTRIFFGAGAGGLLRLRDGVWQDLEPEVPEPAGDGGEAAAESGPPPAEPFRFRASVARPGDTLLLCSTGLAEPLRGEPALARELAARWADDHAPGLAAFLADSQLRVKGYADDRTSVGVWEA
ncbi:protein phosphatase 2C domain-containing protein [Streptomyces sp. NBC_01221]|uniref:protein phosphatase 2C domain-containing protein n=1 Tax=Streptomyces sp. NBC_01221 TaxID=2903782 RepID=UPI00225C3A8F|nr:protein phosphatase 2C domain-containing protein [Streptomyces sp. NBC_01221]MCX4790173.1 protein phosphatase 2C domain-containing protein [Streptomyces sp. NBC_01221]